MNEACAARQGQGAAQPSCPSQLETVCWEGRSEKRVRVMHDEDTEYSEEDEETEAMTTPLTRAKRTRSPRSAECG